MSSGSLTGARSPSRTHPSPEVGGWPPGRARHARSRSPRGCCCSPPPPPPPPPPTRPRSSRRRRGDPPPSSWSLLRSSALVVPGDCRLLDAVLREPDGRVVVALRRVRPSGGDEVAPVDHRHRPQRRTITTGDLPLLPVTFGASPPDEGLPSSSALRRPRSRRGVRHRGAPDRPRSRRSRDALDPSCLPATPHRFVVRTIPGPSRDRGRSRRPPVSTARIRTSCPGLDGRVTDAVPAGPMSVLR